MPKKKPKFTLDKWKKYMGVIIATFAVLGIVGSQAETIVEHVNIKAYVIAQNAAQDKKSELREIKSQRRDLNYQVFQLQKQQDQVWGRHPMTRRDQIRAKKLERSIRALEKDLDDLKEREKELNK